MPKEIPTGDVNAAAWAAHKERERIAAGCRGMTGLNADLILLRARRLVAQRKPGCAAAILSADPTKNWDRGQLVRDEMQMMRDSGEYPED